MSGAFHIEDIYPIIDGGRFPVKRLTGNAIEVWADVFRGGHDVIVVNLVCSPILKAVPPSFNVTRPSTAKRPECRLRQ